MSKNFKLTVQKDHISNLAKATPVVALSELIWNALDADANKVEVFFNENDQGQTSVIVKDNGSGIEYAKVEKLFGSLGGSWKGHKEKTESGRFLHGKKGQGRFKAFAIGRVVVWKVIYKKDNIFYEYQIECFADKLDYFIVSEEIESDKNYSGVEVSISEIYKKSGHLTDSNFKKLVSIFALYLIRYSPVIIFLNGEKIELKDFIKNDNIMPLNNIEYNDVNHAVELRILEWNNSQIDNKELLFCDSKGFVLENYRGRQFKVGGDFSFSAFLKSSLIEDLQTDNLLAFPELEPLKPLIDNTLSTLQTYFFDRRLADCQAELEKWKEEKIYPYENEALNPVEEAERKVFDIVAVNIKRNLPSFDKNDKKGKKFQLRMLKQAIEKNPEELQTIIEEVLQLTDSKRNEFALLLKETSLTSIISASALVSDRLKFIAGLEELIFDTEAKKHFKERSQLHKILAENTWIFGDEFSLSVSDKSLTTVLKKHSELINQDIVIDSPVTLIDGSRGIVDLMLSKSIPRNHKEELEHLVVELKAPKVNIGDDEIRQIKKYAFAVAKDERFRNINTRWNFWIISNDIDDFAQEELKQHKNESGLLYKTDGLMIWVKTWSEVIRENKHRLEFIRSQLDYNIEREDAVTHLKEKYAEFTKGIKTSFDKEV
ncbi:MAG: ATP-binding protein [Methylococcales bacterium]